MATAASNILVVEDDRETRALIAKYLRSNACNVMTANDGREMARTMTDHRVDLVILDVMLPGEDGLSLCRKIRAELRWHCAPARRHGRSIRICSIGLATAAGVSPAAIVAGWSR